MTQDRGGLKGGQWIALHDGMPDHPKVEDLSDRAFRTLISLWCWCGRHLTDGEVTAKIWRKFTTAAVRRELVAAGLVDEHDDGSVAMHDYLDWQRSASDVAQVTATKRTAGLLGNHRRWHEKTGRVDPACEWCVTTPDPSQEPSQQRSHVRSHMGSQNGRREEKRREEPYGDLGGEGRETYAHERPRPHDPRCDQPCHVCRDARLADQRAATLAAQRKTDEQTERARRRKACGSCDDFGWVLAPDGRPVEPARRCTHIRLVDTTGATG